MKTLRHFEFQSKNVRTVIIGGEVNFVARDVAEVLGYVDPINAIKQHCRGVVKRHPIVDRLGRSQQARIISEADLMRLVVHSKLPAAERFERWVFEEVLPTIRRTGSYSVAAPAAMDLSSISRRQLAEAIIAESDRADIAEAQLAIAAPKVAAFETFMGVANDFSVRVAAQMLQNEIGIEFGQKLLFRWLRDNRWIGQDNSPYQTHLKAGLLAVKASEYVIRHRDGSETLAAPRVRITPKGLERLRKELTAEQTIPAPAVTTRRKLRSLNP
ncbi:prophage antirepressor-like protein [Arthrobacter sp. UYEF6]